MKLDLPIARSAMRISAWTWLMLTVAGCSPNLMHVGYTPSMKVWYHWVHSGDEHSIVVCDVQPDGSETNCVESEM